MKTQIMKKNMDHTFKVKEKAGVKGKMLFMPIRIAASGIMHGPELADTLYLIGKEEILNRLEK